MIIISDRMCVLSSHVNLGTTHPSKRMKLNLHNYLMRMTKVNPFHFKSNSTVTDDSI